MPAAVDVIAAQAASAAGAVDEGTSVKIGGKAGSTATSVSELQRANAWFDLAGRVITQDREITGESQTRDLVDLLTQIRDGLARIEIHLSLLTDTQLS